MTYNNAFQQAVIHRGRTVLAMDCVLAEAQWHRGRPLTPSLGVHRYRPR